jgi:hypothetical protein
MVRNGFNIYYAATRDFVAWPGKFFFGLCGFFLKCPGQQKKQALRVYFSSKNLYLFSDKQTITQKQSE